MNTEQQLEQVKEIIRNLEPYETLEIKLEDNRKGRIAVTRKYSKRDVIVVRENL